MIATRVVLKDVEQAIRVTVSFNSCNFTKMRASKHWRKC